MGETKTNLLPEDIKKMEIMPKDPCKLVLTSKLTPIEKLKASDKEKDKASRHRNTLARTQTNMQCAHAARTTRYK